jgi:hypothetical protein
MTKKAHNTASLIEQERVRDLGVFCVGNQQRPCHALAHQHTQRFGRPWPLQLLR